MLVDGAGEFVSPMLIAAWRRSAFVRPEGRAEGSEGVGGDIERSLLPLIEFALLNAVCIAPVNDEMIFWSGLRIAWVTASTTERSPDKPMAFVSPRGTKFDKGIAVLYVSITWSLGRSP